MLKIYTLAVVACALAFSNVAAATTPVDVVKGGQALLNNMTNTALADVGAAAQPSPVGSGSINNPNPSLNISQNAAPAGGADSQNSTAPGAASSTTLGPK